MKVFLEKNSGIVRAEGIFDPVNNSVLVKAGAKVSAEVSENKNFGGADKIRKLREANCREGITINDLLFTSPTTAANFITGMNTNGLIAWKTTEGKTLKEM